MPKDLRIKIKEAEKDLDNYNYHSLYPSFKIPEGMSVDKFKKILKDNVVYQKFMRSLPGKGEKY